MQRRGRLARWGGTRVSRRVLRSIPFVGTAVALAYLGRNLQRKGTLRGALDSGLNAIPFLGATKTLAEMLRGREFIEDRPQVENERE